MSEYGARGLTTNIRNITCAFIILYFQLFSKYLWALLIDLCVLPWQWSLEKDYSRGKEKIQRCSLFVFVCYLKRGTWEDGFLCDSFVMDADGECFLLVSPPDYKMKTDFSLNCGSQTKQSFFYKNVKCGVDGIFFDVIVTRLVVVIMAIVNMMMMMIIIIIMMMMTMISSPDDLGINAVTFVAHDKLCVAPLYFSE